MAEGGRIVIRYIYRGEEGEVIPRRVTHIIVDESVTVVLARAFYCHPNIVEVICHDNVKKIGREAFLNCRSLRRLILPGVKIAEKMAFAACNSLTDVECDKLEIIKVDSFCDCRSLRNIKLPSAKIVEGEPFCHCTALTDVKFGNNLERLGKWAFAECHSLERITIPLKDNLMTTNDTFQECENLRHVDLLEGVIHENIAALQLEDWRNNMNEEIDSINQILPDARAGNWVLPPNRDEGEKAAAIRAWIRSVLGKMGHYQAEHNRLLNEAATTLQLRLPQDILMNNVLPFLELTTHWS